MKKSETWKNEYGIIEDSKEEIVYLESYKGKEVSFEEIFIKTKKVKKDKTFLGV